MARGAKTDMVRPAGLPQFLERIKGECGLDTIADIQPELPVRTMFTSYNRATGIGGHPMRRLVLMHGPNQSGKSAMALGIAESLRRAGQIPIVFDTEFSAEKRWYGELGMASEIPFKMVGVLDELVSKTQELFNKLVAARSAKRDKLDSSVGYCFVVDTITKLVPNEVLIKIEKEGISKQFPAQANATSLWMKVLIPQLYRLNSTMILVTQERENLDKGTFGPKYKIGGGQSLQFDTSLRVHMTDSEKVKCGQQVVGTRHDYRVEKNKSAGVSNATGSIFLSNGLGACPLGFDVAAEVVEEAKYRECLKRKNGATVLEIGDVKVAAEDVPTLEGMLREDSAMLAKVQDALDNGLAQ